MILYLIKGIGCSLVLWAFHYYFLEKERMHVFNRFYLLAAPLISLIVPFIPLRRAIVQAEVAPPAPLETPEGSQALLQVLEASSQQITPLADSISMMWLPGLYIVVAAFLFIRLLLILLRISRKIRSSTVYKTPNGTIVGLSGQNGDVFTFLNYVFCSDDEYRNGKIPELILRHEFTHVAQRHTWDILYLELLSVLWWFNPVLMLFKKAVKLNHEFLADQPLTRHPGKIAGYQRLLLERLTRETSPVLVSGFNYSQTKKRLTMMTQTQNRSRVLLKAACLTLLVATLGYIASDEIRAQEAPPNPSPLNAAYSQASPPPPPPPPFDPTQLPVLPPPPKVEKWVYGEGLSDAELADYIASFERHKIQKTNAKGQTYSEFSFSKSEKERLYKVFRKMNKEQQQEQKYVLFQRPIPKKNPPSEELFESFKMPEFYGVWLNGKKVDNSALDIYKNTDIAGFGISKLYGAAKKGRNYSHQLDLETNEFFDAHLNERMQDRIWASERIRTPAAK